MAQIPIKDILITARQESHRMRHFYLGVEHLFIALLEIKSGITSAILSDNGLAPEYVIDRIRRKVAKGSRHRLWAGVPNTPRTDVVLSIAHEIAQEDGRKNIVERDLLVAILDERDNIPVRALVALGLDVADLRRKALTRDTPSIPQTFVTVDFAPDFGHEVDNEVLFILRRMFHGYAQIRIQTQLTGGYSSSQLFVVTPIHIDKREDASVVVKIGQADFILDEAQRYERFVKSTLPPMTARLEEKPTAPDTSNLAGLKYTFMTDSDGNPSDLRGIVQKWSGEKLGQWLYQRLFQYFGENWWRQNRPYLFEAWQEYDWLLPPMLTLEISGELSITDSIQTLKHPIRRTRVEQLTYGDTVVVENFIVQKVNYEKKTLRLALGQGSPTTRAFQIEIRGIDFERNTYFRGEVVERLAGRVWKTRREELREAVRALEPDFDVSGDDISVNNIHLPNPILAYVNLLDETVQGTLSIIHGDLHLGNILLGQADSALLIDFGLTREGHTVFDWATLEISLLAEMLMPLVGEGWHNVRELMSYMVAMNASERRLNAPADVADGLEVIRALRKIVQRCLATSQQWQEYFLSLALVSLRAMLWETMSLDNRRLMYLLSALAMHEYHERQKQTGESLHTPSPDDDTDYFS
jgi:hypothetical protein